MRPLQVFVPSRKFPNKSRQGYATPPSPRFSNFTGRPQRAPRIQTQCRGPCRPPAALDRLARPTSGRRPFRPLPVQALRPLRVVTNFKLLSYCCGGFSRHKQELGANASHLSLLILLASDFYHGLNPFWTFDFPRLSAVAVGIRTSFHWPSGGRETYGTPSRLPLCW